MSRATKRAQLLGSAQAVCGTKIRERSNEKRARTRPANGPELPHVGCATRSCQHKAEIGEPL
jgi:hypothetical protein